MIFIQGDRNNWQFLVVLSSDRSEGVFITEATHDGKLIPVLICKGNLTEVSPAWKGMRKAMFGMHRLRDFKLWLKKVVETAQDNSEIKNGSRFAWIDTDTKQTVDFEKGELEFEEFQKIFFCNEDHASVAQFNDGVTRRFPTARGSKWLAKILKENGYAISVEGDPVKVGYSSFEEIFKK